jgi:hypothetical protein
MNSLERALIEQQALAGLDSLRVLAHPAGPSSSGPGIRSSMLACLTGALAAGVAETTGFGQPVTRQDLAAAQLTASRRAGTGLRLCRTAFAKVDSDRQGEPRSSGRVSSATETPRHLSSGGSGWLVPVDGTSGPGLRFKALANRSVPAFRCQRLASRASRSSSSQCQDPSRIRRRIRTGP